jgi:hypothetical protein
MLRLRALRTAAPARAAIFCALPTAVFTFTYLDVLLRGLRFCISSHLFGGRCLFKRRKTLEGRGIIFVTSG